MKSDRGFTLIELIVIVLIIAILIAIAIPTFYGAKRRAEAKRIPVKGGIVVKKLHQVEYIHDHTTTVQAGKVPVTTTTHHRHPESWSIRVVNCEQFDPCKIKDFMVDGSIWQAVEIGKWYGVQG